MAKPDVWMPIYIGDYLSDTMHLTTDQHGAYLLLIMAYWKNGGPLPGGDVQLAATCRMSLDAWSIAKEVLVDFFDVSEEGKWVHKRVEKEMVNAGNKKAQAVQKAVNAAAARWGKVNMDAPSIAQGMPEHMLELCPSPSPSPSEEKDQKPCDQQAESRQEALVIPYGEILDSFKARLPGFPQPRRPLDDDRKKAIRAIWVKNEKFGSADFFDRYFKFVSESEFLGSWKGCGFDWLFKYKNFRKVLEGNYDGDSRDA